MPLARHAATRFTQVFRSAMPSTLTEADHHATTVLTQRIQIFECLGEILPSKLEPHALGRDHEPHLELVALGRTDDDRLGLSHDAHELRLLRLPLALEPPRPMPERAPRP
ncbi:MAG: hypothetical protein ACK5U8_14865, partial [Deltaproteobacteria bacterium]